jgi:chromodomain-helicase-DNA-binding protein 7
LQGYEPAPFQVEDLEYLTDRDWSANWSEMGCYKTTTALWLAEQKLQNVQSPAIQIITTKMGKGTYFDAIPKVLPKWIFFNIGPQGITRVEMQGRLELPVTGEEFVKAIMSDSPVVVLAHYHCYMNKSKLREILYGIAWDGLMVDEAHRMKEKDTQWTRNIKKVPLTENGFKHIMTGTGFINRPDELWSLLNFLDPQRFTSYWKFRRHFCEEIEMGGFTRILGIYPDKKEEFRNLRKEVGVRRELKDVRPDILTPIETEIETDLNPTQRKMYNEIRDLLRTYDKKGLSITSPNVLSQLNRLRQVAVATPEKYGDDYYDPKQDRVIQQIRLVEPSSKLDAVMELLENLEWDEENKQQVVVFSCFKDPLKLLEERLKKADIPYLRMLQGMSENERYKLWHDEWPRKEHRVFLTTLALGGESINLSSAQRAIFLDRSWSPKDNMQAVGRIYRPGQEGQTQIIYINAKNTTDKRIAKTNEIKTGWFREIFGDDE